MKDGDANIQIGVDTVNNGETFNFSIPQPSEDGKEATKIVSCNVLASKALDNASRRNADPTSAVWYIKMNVDGDRFRSGNVSMYVNSTGATVMDVWMDGQVGDDNTHAQIIMPKVDHSYSAGGASSGKSPSSI